MSTAQIHDMLQRQIIATEGGYASGYGLQGGYEDMMGGARRKAHAFPKAAKAGLCEYRLFQAEHKGLSRAEMSAKWAKHKARGAGLAGGAREFGDEVDGSCVYRGFKSEHKGMSRPALKRGWKQAKQEYFAKHPKGGRMTGGCMACGGEGGCICGGILSLRARRANVRHRNPKASHSKLMKLYEAARRQYHAAMGRKAPRRRRSMLSKKSPLTGHSIEELIEICMGHASSASEIPAEIVTAIVSHPELSPQMATELLEVAASMPTPAAAEKIVEVAKAVNEEMKHETFEGAPPAPGPPSPMEQAAAEHATAAVMASPEAAMNPEAAKAVVKAAKPKRVLPEQYVTPQDALAYQIKKKQQERAARIASGVVIGDRAQHSALNASYAEHSAATAAKKAIEAEARIAKFLGNSQARLADEGYEELMAEAPLWRAPVPPPPAFSEEEWASGAGRRGGKRMTAAQKKAFLRKCMRS